MEGGGGVREREEDRDVLVFGNLVNGFVGGTICLLVSFSFHYHVAALTLTLSSCISTFRSVGDEHLSWYLPLLLP